MQQTSQAVCFALALGLVATAMPRPAGANPTRSHYTTIDLKTCSQTRQQPDGGSWSCEGLPGWPILVAEGDLRQFVSFGPDAEKRRAATQTLGAFNSIFRNKSSRATIEWRVAPALTPRQQARPVSAIIRHFTSSDGRQGEVLVIYKITPTEACQIGRVDALANPEPDALARSIADEQAATASCNDTARTYGVIGTSPM